MGDFVGEIKLGNRSIRRFVLTGETKLGRLRFVRRNQAWKAPKALAKSLREQLLVVNRSNFVKSASYDA